MAAKEPLLLTKSPENQGINFTEGAVVARYIAKNEQDQFIDAETGRSLNGLLNRFSLMKYGHMPSVRYFAHEIVDRATQTQSLQQFITTAAEKGQTVFITSPGVFNVPSASNLLLKETALLLNSWCSKAGLSPMKIMEQVRLGESTLNYAARSVTDRTKDPATRSILPEIFRGQAVIYLDDIYISGTVAERAKQRLTTEAGAGSSYFLFGLKVDPELVAASDGKIEDALNRRVVDGSLPTLAKVFKDEFIPTQKSVRDFLAVENRADLPAFLETVDPAVITTLYQAATANGFRERWEGQFCASIEIIEQYLASKGHLGIAGELLTPAEIVIRKNKHEGASEKYAGKLAVWEPDCLDDLDPEMLTLYSRMKYSDPEATRIMANRLADKIWSDPLLRTRLLNGDVMISSSAYGEIPTAAANLIDEVVAEFNRRGASVGSFKIDWQGDFGVTNYGKMTHTERAACLAGYQTSISAENQAKIAGKYVLIIDDLSATGSHEGMLDGIMAKTAIDAYSFCCLIDFSEQMAFESAGLEETVNHFAPTALSDLAKYFLEAKVKGLSVKLNTRTVRYILNEANQNESEFVSFLEIVTPDILIDLYSAARSADGYVKIAKFAKGIQELENYLLATGLLSSETVNRSLNRTLGFSVTFSEGKLVDLNTGEDLSEIGREYSLMKFGSAREITKFAGLIASKFINRLDDSADPLHSQLEAIAAAGEYAVYIVPGSRNVASASSLLYQKAFAKINLALALRDLPTIVPFTLSRLETVAGEYAAMPSTARKNLPKASDHLMPGKELYQMGIHVFFADDVRITGSTADALKHSAIGQGVRSFADLYAFYVDPKIAFALPQTESRLNHLVVTGNLDRTVSYILNQTEFVPVQRLLRLILAEKNRVALSDFMASQISDASLLKLYQAALINDYLKDKNYAPSVKLLAEVLKTKGLIDASGDIIT